MTPREMMWRSDKKRLIAHCEAMGTKPFLDPTHLLPTEEDIDSIEIAVDAGNEKGNIVLSQKRLDSIIGNLTTTVLEYLPSFEVPEIPLLDVDAYVDKVKEYQRILKRIGIMDGRQALPTMDFHELTGKIYVPDKLVCLKTIPSLSDDFLRKEEHPWRLETLEATLFQHLALAHIRRTRGEWGDGYQIANHLGGYEVNLKVRQYLDILTLDLLEQRVAERTRVGTHNKGVNPEWGLDVLNDKCDLIWRATLERGYTDAITQYRGVARQRMNGIPYECMAMVDYIQIEGTELGIVIEANHPLAQQKYDIYNLATNPSGEAHKVLEQGAAK